MTHLLVLRVGYMERYDGPDTITSGGAYVDAKGVGGEVFNFKPSRGKCYGYAMSRHWSGLDLGHFDDSVDWKPGDELSGVDVVFIAKRPGHGQVVVGWYRNATIFHKQYPVRRGTIPGMSALKRHFLCTADASDAHLLPEIDRTFKVPNAPARNPGFPGQSNVWYPQPNSPHVAVIAFVKKLRKYLTSKTGVPLPEDEVIKGGKGGRASTPDHAHNLEVESASVEYVIAHYKALKYKVESVESDNMGWDLELKKGGQHIYIEVKGVSASAIYFELTPNEYEKLKEHAIKYRVCVVCDALTSPSMFELIPRRLNGKWELLSQDQSVFVPLRERTAAVGAEVKA